jgi:hypothetical protein
VVGLSDHKGSLIVTVDPERITLDALLRLAEAWASECEYNLTLRVLVGSDVFEVGYADIACKPYEADMSALLAKALSVYSKSAGGAR